MKPISIILSCILYLSILCAQTPEQDAAWLKLQEQAQTLADKGQNESLQKMLEQALLAQSDKKSRPRADLALLLAKNYYSQDAYENASRWFEEANRAYEALGLADTSDIRLRTHVNRATAARLAARYTLALEASETVLSYEGLKPIFIIRALKERAVNFGHIGLASRGLEDIEQALVISKSQSFPLDELHLDKALLLQKSNEFNKSINLLRTIPPSFVAYEKVVGLMAICFVEIFNQTKNTRSLDSAFLYANKALLLTNNTSEGYFLALITAAQVLRLQKRFDEAEKQLKIALAFSGKTHAAKSTERANIYQSFGQFHQDQGQYDQALDYFHKQLLCLFEDYNSADFRALPDLTTCQKASNLDALTDALAYKARAFRLRYVQSKDIADLQAALAHSQRFDELVELIRREFRSSDGSRFLWSNISKDAYENALEVCFLQLQAQPERKVDILNQALYFIEKSKALALLEAFQNAKAKEVAGLPAQLLQEELKLKAQVDEANKEFYDMQRKRRKTSADSSRMLELQGLVFERQQTYLNFLKRLEQDYPEYYRLKHQVRLPKIADLQGLLATDQALVNYFVGDEAIFALKITASGQAELSRQAIGFNFVEEIVELRRSVYGFYLENNDLSDDKLFAQYAERYVKSATDLYQKLIKPLGDLPARLLVIPDGALGHAPFDVLLSSTPAEAKDFKTHPYLLRSHSLSYAYSAALLQEMMRPLPSQPSNFFLGIAPEFGNGRAAEVRGKRFAFGPLAFNKTEVNQVKGVVGAGTVLEGQAATEAAFLERAGQYRIVHFATHGMANDLDPDYSLLAFTEVEDSVENEYIFVRDLYSLRLNADMVVLSACETGIGRLQKGEGILSLARGFAYAGSKSIFTTLWSVNDLSTSNIVQAFYQGLKAGLPKDVALQKAKLGFLEQNEGRNVHPFLWSPYIVVGDSQAIEFPGFLTVNGWWLYPSVLGLGLLAVLALARRRSRQA